MSNAARRGGAAHLGLGAGAGIGVEVELEVEVGRRRLRCLRLWLDFPIRIADGRGAD